MITIRVVSCSVHLSRKQPRPHDHCVGGDLRLGILALLDPMRELFAGG